jgi:hypothetical protein
MAMGLLDEPPHWLLSTSKSFQYSGPMLDEGSYENSTSDDEAEAAVVARIVRSSATTTTIPIPVLVLFLFLLFVAVVIVEAVVVAIVAIDVLCGSPSLTFFTQGSCPSLFPPTGSVRDRECESINQVPLPAVHLLYGSSFVVCCRSKAGKRSFNGPQRTVCLSVCRHAFHDSILIQKESIKSMHKIAP